MVMLENRKYDPMKAWANTSWTFCSKRGNDLEYVDRVDLEHHVYSLSELSALLREAGGRPRLLMEASRHYSQ